MITLRLDLGLYSLAVIQQGIAAYRDIADISVRCREADVTMLDLTSQGCHDEALVMDEFLNYLIALIVKSPEEA